MTPASISRRAALGAVVVGATGVAVGTAGWLAGLSGAAGRWQPVASAEPFAEPAVLTSRDGVLDVELVAARGVRVAGRATLALGFNGVSPGPTLRVAPGDLLRVRLTNHLDQPTNLHTHGLRVSPQGQGDNPFVSIAAGATFDYSYRIAADHPVGTYWYHPHHHGHAADQLFGGLAGGLLVENGPDLPVAGDQVLLVTDITMDVAGRVATAGPMDRMMGREGELVLVNGQHQPVIGAAPGAAQRWRVINACISRVLALRLAGQLMIQVAQDGVFLPAPVERKQVVLAPGNRADVIVPSSRAGRYPLVTDPYDRGSTGTMDGPMMGGPMGTGGAAGPITLATVVVEGPTASSPPLPAALPAPPVPPGPAVRQRQLTLAMGVGGMGIGGMSFTIDGRTFDARRDDQTVRLGDTEDWTITNTSPLDHPFHLHIWPFHVLADSIGTPRTAALQDVVVVPARGWVRLRIPFTDHPGRSVYHCHTLDHEDGGMMGTLNVAA